MKTFTNAFLLAIAAAFAVSPAAAAPKRFLMPPVALDTTSELVVGIVNTCKAPATYKVTVRNGLNGHKLKQKSGTIDAGKGAAVLYRSALAGRDAVYAVAQLECAAEATSLPLLAGFVRDFGSKAPRFSGCFIGEGMEGNCI